MGRSLGRLSSLVMPIALKCSPAGAGGAGSGQCWKDHAAKHVARGAGKKHTHT